MTERLSLSFSLVERLLAASDSFIAGTSGPGLPGELVVQGGHRLLGPPPEFLVRQSCAGLGICISGPILVDTEAASPATL